MIILRCNYSLEDINIFHSDRGNEYDNALIDDILSTFKINRSLSNKLRRPVSCRRYDLLVYLKKIVSTDHVISLYIDGLGEIRKK